MRYRILGPLELLDENGHSVPIGGPRESVLLAVLLLEANRVVSSDRLIEALWGEHPPQTAANALQVHISKLRKTLAVSSADGRLQTKPPGYVLVTSRGELDSELFEDLAADSRPGEEPHEVSSRLADALDLWRGSVLDGIDTALYGRSDLARLE
jgi:DNA-binding SARP family transcriptional activator